MTTAAPPQRLQAAVPAVIVAAWLLALWIQAAGGGEALHHDTLIESGPPVWAALLLFLLVWQMMIAAMMLPSSLPLIRLFTAASSRQRRPGLVVAAFLGGYALVWSVFGGLAFLGDMALHQLVHRSLWLESHSWLIAGSTLGFAGACQFSSVKRRCLTECRHPASFLAANYARGVNGAFRLGRRHGVFCLGCCFALMLLMFAAGVANLLWMAALTALMVYEKTGRAGARAVTVSGGALLVWAAAVLAHPAWLPPYLAGAL